MVREPGSTATIMIKSTTSSNRRDLPSIHSWENVVNLTIWSLIKVRRSANSSSPPPPEWMGRFNCYWLMPIILIGKLQIADQAKLPNCLPSYPEAVATIVQLIYKLLVISSSIRRKNNNQLWGKEINCARCLPTTKTSDQHVEFRLNLIIFPYDIIWTHRLIRLSRDLLSVCIN